MTEVRKFYHRCVRGVTYHEFVDEFSFSSTIPSPSSSIKEAYFLSKRERINSLLNQYEGQCHESMRDDTGQFEINNIRRTNTPMDLNGRGNFYLTSLHHLEHHADQLEYLVNVVEALPPLFLDVVYAVRYKIIPEIVRVHGGTSCSYNVQTRGFSPSDCKPDFRILTYLLNPWMTDAMHGTFGSLIHMPTPRAVPPKDSFCLNPNLDFEEIQESYIAGRVVVIDNLLTDRCHAELRRLALEGTIFYEGKKSYLGAYVDEGMGESPWLLTLSEEWQVRFPKFMSNLPLSTSWFYKYDSDSSAAGGIGIHADQAIVNINIWITPDSANLDPDSGGLIVYDTAPTAEEIQGTGFQKWNDKEFEGFRAEWLRDNGAKQMVIPYRANRAVVFDSRRLHATDDYSFKQGYENRRINLTLLYGISGDTGGRIDNNIGKFPNEYSTHS